MKREYRRINGKTISRPAVVIVDWDGTIVSEHWPAMGKFLEGACDALRSLLRQGYIVKVHSCRLHSEQWSGGTQKSNGDLEKMRTMLDKEGLNEILIIS